MPRGLKADVDRAVQAAKDALDGQWSKWTPVKRQKLMLKIAEEIEKRVNEFAAIESYDNGKPFADA